MKNLKIKTSISEATHLIHKKCSWVSNNKPIIVKIIDINKTGIHVKKTNDVVKTEQILSFKSYSRKWVPMKFVRNNWINRKWYASRILLNFYYT